MTTPNDSKYGNDKNRKSGEATFGDAHSFQETEQVGTVDATTTQRASTGSGKNRIVIVVLGVLALGILIILGAHFRKSDGTNSQSNIANTPNVQNIPGTSTDSKYNHLQDSVNDKASAAAKAHNGSYVPVPVGNSGDDSTDPYDKLNNQKPAPDSKPAQVVQTPVVNAQPQPQPQPAYQPPAQAVVQQNQDLQKNDEKQMSNFLDAWVYNSDKTYTEYDTTGKAKSVNGSSAQTSTGPNAYGQGPAPTIPVIGSNKSVNAYGQENGSQLPGSTNGSGVSGGTGVNGETAVAGTNPAVKDSQTASATFVHAGVIVPVDIVTPVNTDYIGPVRAIVTAGPLKGAIILATPKRENDKIVIDASTISIPNQPHSFSIKAVMTDADDAAPYMSTSVNNHYFKHYTLLTLSALASGYGQAVTRENSTVTQNPLGGVSTSYGNVDNKQIIGESIGQVGTNLSSELQNQAQQQPTVKLQGKKGEPFHYPAGMLFLSDF